MTYPEIFIKIDRHVFFAMLLKDSQMDGWTDGRTKRDENTDKQTKREENINDVIRQTEVKTKQKPILLLMPR